MKKGKKLSILLASTMIFNLFAFPSIAGASTLGKNTVYKLEGDTNEPAMQTPEAKVKTVLDISKGNITISRGSVTGFTPSGAAATPNSAGYEITGTTTTNKVVVNDAVPIALNGANINYSDVNTNSAIEMISGGEITVLGTNTISRTLQTNDFPLIMTTNNAALNIQGTGTLNITDSEDKGATIGAQTARNPLVNILGSVSINIDKDGTGAAIGTNNVNSVDVANITIEDGVKLKVSNNSTATTTFAAGIGIPKSAPITSEMIAKTNIKISPRANIDAPVRENYYKDPTGSVIAYKTRVYGLNADTDLSIVYGGTTKTVKTFADGALYLYLSEGDQVATIAGDRFETQVIANANNRMFIKTLLTAANISVHASEGVVGQSLRGHETTNSPAGIIKYTLVDAGETGAVLDKTTLHWKKPGKIQMNVSQTESGKYSQASTDFVVNIIEATGDIEVSVSVDVSSAGFGRVAVRNQANKEILPFVQPGAEITLNAIPNEGYEIAKWIKTTQVTKAKKGSRAVITETLIATPSLRIIAQAGESYTAFFQRQEVVPGPKLDVLEVSSMVIQPNGTLVEKNKPLILQDGTEDVLFNPNKLAYGLYLRSIDTDNINIYLRHSDTERIDIKVGNLPEEQVKVFVQYKVSLTLNGSAYQEIPIAVRRGTEITTYVIKVFKEQKAENDPHVYAELEINPIKEVLELGVYAVNVDVNAFTMTMKIDELLPADKKAFESFVNNKGVAFNNLGTNLAGDLANYFNLDPKFEIADMRSDGKFISVTVNTKAGWGPIKVGATPRKILSLNIKRNVGYKGKIINEIDTLMMEPVLNGNMTYGNSLSSKFYGDMNDTFEAIRAEDEQTLSYLVFRGKEDFIKMYVSFDANVVDRVDFEIIDVSVPNNRQIVASGPVVNYEIDEAIIQSTYRVRVLAGGYLLAESQDIIYDGTPAEFGIIMTPVALLEGDLDDSGTINALDRTKLISVLNGVVDIKGSGFITLGNDKIYADYNNDNRVNSLDLGRLVQNIGKQYSAIHKA